jgi:hypothetical protein
MKAPSQRDKSAKRKVFLEMAGIEPTSLGLENTREPFESRFRDPDPGTQGAAPETIRQHLTIGQHPHTHGAVSHAEDGVYSLEYQYLFPWFQAEDAPETI